MRQRLHTQQRSGGATRWKGHHVAYSGARSYSQPTGETPILHVLRIAIASLSPTDVNSSSAEWHCSTSMEGHTTTQPRPARNKHQQPAHSSRHAAVGTQHLAHSIWHQHSFLRPNKQLHFTRIWTKRDRPAPSQVGCARSSRAAHRQPINRCRSAIRASLPSSRPSRNMTICRPQPCWMSEHCQRHWSPVCYLRKRRPDRGRHHPSKD